MTGNNGTADLSYTASIADRAGVRPATSATTAGLFHNGTKTGAAAYADFGLSYDPYNSGYQGAAGGTYTVRTGDTLASIAQALWGDANLWYKLAAANGMSGNAALIEGQTLTLPTGVTRSSHSASTFKPYDPTDALGDLSPTTPKPPKKPKCGVFGQILVAAIAIAVTAILPGSGTVVGAMINGAIGSAVSQGVGVATGIQDKFSLKGVAVAAITAGIGGGGDVNFLQRVAIGAAANAASQGIGVAIGLQSKFDFAGVAAAGLGAGIGAEIGGALATAGASSLAARAGAMTASAISSAATRSALTGDGFGDSLERTLPSAIGQFIGEAFVSAVGSGAAVERKEAGKTVNAPKGDPKMKTDGADTLGEAAAISISGHVQFLGGARVAFIRQPDGKYSFDLDPRVGHTKMVNGTYTKQDAEQEIGITITALVGTPKSKWIAAVKVQITRAIDRGDPRSVEANEAFLAEIRRGRYDRYMTGGAAAVPVAAADIIVTASTPRKSFLSTKPVMVAGGNDGPIVTVADASTLASSGGGFWSDIKSAGESFAAGFAGGDRLSDGSISAEIGNFASSVFAYGDFRDTASAVYGIYRGEKGAWGDLALAGIGFVPIVGDVGKQALKHGDEVLDAFGEARRLGGAAEATAAERLAANAAKGRAFERAGIDGILRHVGLGKNTTAVTRNGVTTIPDSAGRPVGLVEFKDVANLSSSPQLRAQLAEALATGQPYNLVVSPGNKTISKPLLDQIREVNQAVGGGVYRYDPVTDILTPWKR